MSDIGVSLGHALMSEVTLNDGTRMPKVAAFFFQTVNHAVKGDAQAARLLMKALPLLAAAPEQEMLSEQPTRAEQEAALNAIFQEMAGRFNTKHED